jgi:spore maturation protein CgeB
MTPYSDGWPSYARHFHQATFQSPVSFTQSMELLKRSKICLNSVPSFKNGTHVRVFSSLSAGAVPVTGDNLYWQEHFKDGEQIILYQHGEWEDLNQKIDHLLQNQQHRHHIAQAGREQFLKSHTWDARVSLFLQKMPPILKQIEENTFLK